MSSLVRKYSKEIQKQLGMRAAWLPVTNTFRCGDYGQFDKGVFMKVGNIYDRYADLTKDIDAGPAASINYVSEGVRTLKLNAAGEPIQSFSELGEFQATLKFEFTKKNSIVLNAKEITSLEIQNVGEVADYLNSKPEWRHKYRIISSVYVAKGATVLCSEESDTSFSIHASAEVLKQIELGKLSAGLEFDTERSKVFNSIGDEGVLAMKLFKVNRRGLPKDAARSFESAPLEPLFELDEAEEVDSVLSDLF